MFGAFTIITGVIFFVSLGPTFPGHKTKLKEKLLTPIEKNIYVELNQNQIVCKVQKESFYVMDIDLMFDDDGRIIRMYSEGSSVKIIQNNDEEPRMVYCGYKRDFWLQLPMGWGPTYRMKILYIPEDSLKIDSEKITLPG